MDSTTWQMPLKNPPQLVQAGRAVHGKKRRLEEYQLPELWCLHLYGYDGFFSIDGCEFEIKPGWASVTPPNARIVYRFNGESRHIFAHFQLPAGGDLVAMPAMQELGAAFEPLSRAMEEAAGWLPSQPRRASVRLWDVLWQLAGQPMAENEPGKRLHPALSRAVREIELHLAQPLAIPAIARRAEISHNHLTRLFRAQFGATIEGYIRRRRVERALHLLAHTTLAIKTIAGEVGLPDLHFFNKTIRAAAKLSPREYRARRAER
ncbi:MAG: AraC family transcriptional regulator [Verrucomicrobia bacterium]|nr:AraC family transcriptional regulator [Verrucomicrobiota bacterium]